MHFIVVTTMHFIVVTTMHFIVYGSNNIHRGEVSPNSFSRNKYICLFLNLCVKDCIKLGAPLSSSRYGSYSSTVTFISLIVSTPALNIVSLIRLLIVFIEIGWCWGIFQLIQILLKFLNWAVLLIYSIKFVVRHKMAYSLNLFISIVNILINNGNTLHHQLAICFSALTNWFVLAICPIVRMIKITNNVDVGIVAQSGWLKLL